MTKYCFKHTKLMSKSSGKDFQYVELFFHINVYVSFSMFMELFLSLWNHFHVHGTFSMFMELCFYVHRTFSMFMKFFFMFLEVFPCLWNFSLIIKVKTVDFSLKMVTEILSKNAVLLCSRLCTCKLLCFFKKKNLIEIFFVRIIKRNV